MDAPIIAGLVGIVVIVGLVYSAIATYQSQQVRLKARAERRRQQGLDAADRAEHARREAAARRLDDG